MPGQAERENACKNVDCAPFSLAWLGDWWACGEIGAYKGRQLRRVCGCVGACWEGIAGRRRKRGRGRLAMAGA